MKHGQITVFLSLVCILVISFIGGMITSAAIQVSKNEKRAAMNSAMESLFAEYQIELLKDYDIFALEATYETGEFAYDNVFSRLQYYGAGNAGREVKAVQFLTDNNGRAFREQVAAFMGEQLKQEDTDEIEEGGAGWSEQEDQALEYQQEEKDVYQQIEADLSGAEEELPEEGNPLNHIAAIKQTGLLKAVVPSLEELSNRQVVLEQLPSHRELNKGYGEFERSSSEGILTKALFREYLLSHFSHFTQPSEEGVLSYELEYLLGGKSNDKDNLEAVVEKLIMVRYVPNYGYLLSDSTKQAEADALALSLCTLLTVPAISKLVKHAILLAWAYGESLMDVRSLLAGGKVELIKNADNWQLSLSNLLKLGTSEDNQDGRDMEKGLDYQEYLRILLYTQNQDHLTMRSLDLIEQNMKISKELSFFQADQCISKMKILSTYHLQGNITYDFNSEFYYR